MNLIQRGILLEKLFSFVSDYREYRAIQTVEFSVPVFGSEKLNEFLEKFQVKSYYARVVLPSAWCNSSCIKFECKVAMFEGNFYE